MKKTFTMENDIGLNVKYTILATNYSDNEEYIIYTNYLPSDNELGVRLFLGKVKNADPLEVEVVKGEKEKELIEAFKVEVISSGKKIRRVL